MRQRHGLTVTMPTRRVAGARVSSRKTNEDGHVWSSAGDGVHCIDPSGSLLGKIKVPFTVSNLTFGGRCRSRLFICASQALFAIYTNQRGAQRP
jgi:gluconolactonase